MIFCAVCTLFDKFSINAVIKTKIILNLLVTFTRPTHMKCCLQRTRDAVISISATVGMINILSICNKPLCFALFTWSHYWFVLFVGVQML